ncbi:uncharacterized protein [Haliotis cracherodii]|uniref:uncharacterized protein n=1 Tax=Haliotis cracherodii TaxID=6455 RepID=UPI0039E8E87B
MLIYTLSAFCASMLVTAAEAADPVSLTDVIKLQMPCPIFDCMYLACPSGQYKTNYVTINGHHCPSCQTCVDTASITARKISPNLLPCPIFECKFCPSGNYEPNHITVNGQSCPACGTCLDSAILSGRDIEDVECPAPMCAATNECDQADLVVSYFDFNGKECPGCKMCPM